MTDTEQNRWLELLQQISTDLGWHTDSRGRDVVEVPIEILIDWVLADRAKQRLKAEIKVHDEYWHSQRYVEEHGIGALALANKEATELELRALSQPQTKKENEPSKTYEQSYTWAYESKIPFPLFNGLFWWPLKSRYSCQCGKGFWKYKSYTAHYEKTHLTREANHD